MAPFLVKADYAALSACMWMTCLELGHLPQLHMPNWLKDFGHLSTFENGKMENAWSTVAQFWRKFLVEDLKLHQEAYLGKVHPVTIQKGAGPNTDLTAKEITQLGGLCGALQWPAVQSAPHLQASTSITSGMVNNGKVSSPNSHPQVRQGKCRCGASVYAPG